MSQNPHNAIVAGIEAGNPTLVCCIEDERLEFQEGDVVEFSEASERPAASWLGGACRGTTCPSGKVHTGDPRLKRLGAAVPAVWAPLHAAAAQEGRGRVPNAPVALGMTTICAHRTQLCSLLQVKGMEELNGVKAKVRSVDIKQNTFVVDVDTSAFSAYAQGGLVTQVKQHKTIAFRPLSDALKRPGEFLLLDFAKFDRSPQLHIAFAALDRFRAARGALPRPWDAEDGAELLRLAGEVNEGMEEARVESLDEDVIRKLAFTARGYLNPMAAMFGGIVGQEVIKACSGKFHPIMQWLYFDCIEALPSSGLTPADCAPTGSRHDPQVAVFGQAMQRKLAATRAFVVGAGALGCEFLKNLALMGVGCGGGEVTVTDDDQIERSNLSRQFLFRDWDIGSAKSECAARAAKAINPALSVRPLQNRVSPDTEDVFDDAFWEGLDVVVNALDNVKARLYVDQRCVYFCRPLLESGTLGPKCNTQMVIPHLTENYGASRDPPEKEAPMCTVHSFPHNIDHTLVWARSEFEGMFDAGPKEAAKFLRDPSKYIEDARASRDMATKQALERCLSLLEAGVRPETYEDCVRFARDKFQEYFWNFIVQLTTTFPEDAVTSTGSRFWSPPKVRSWTGCRVCLSVCEPQAEPWAMEERHVSWSDSTNVWVNRG